jgi:hypothetical protein
MSAAERVEREHNMINKLIGEAIDVHRWSGVIELLFWLPVLVPQNV